MNASTQWLNLADHRLAYQQLLAAEDKKNNSPGVVFLGGYASDMNGAKASFLAERCRREGFACLRFDYRGHGQSDGKIADCTIGDWLEDALCVFDRLTTGPQLLVGSSMGGWMALLLA
ncbi:MAG: alpha/beta hydrolase, partial [Alphaproteobacteria bacterium]|nr:alpha/beta hydrolase [Alphaproteobacteria bacterium]